MASPRRSASASLAVGEELQRVHEEVEHLLGEAAHEPQRGLRVTHRDRAAGHRQGGQEGGDLGRRDRPQAEQVAQRVVDPVGAQLRERLLQQPPPAVVEQRPDAQAVGGQHARDLRPQDEALEVRLVVVLAPAGEQLVGDVGEGGVRDVVDEAGGLLLHRAAEAADEQHDPHRVLVAGHVPARPHQVAGPRLVDPPQPLHRGRPEQRQQERLRQLHLRRRQDRRATQTRPGTSRPRSVARTAARRRRGPE